MFKSEKEEIINLDKGFALFYSECTPKKKKILTFMKVFIYIAETWLYSSVGIHSDIALEQIEKGNEVFILNCDQTIGGCMENPNWNPVFCKLCMAFQKKEMKYILPKGVEQHWMKEFVKQLKEEDIPKLQYNTAKELRTLTFHGVDVGMGVMSTYISQTRNLNPEINEKSRAYFDALIREQIITTLVFEQLQKKHGFGLVVFQNGRGAQFKPLLNICKNQKIDFICTEEMSNAEGHSFLNHFYNDIPHSITANNQKYVECWERTQDSEEKREKIARSFFENRRNAVFAGDTIYVKNQVQGQMPEEWRNDVENIVIFNSSEDEFCAVSKEFDDASFFSSQIEGIKSIVEHYKDDKTKHFTLRVHPNLRKIPYKYHLDLYKLDYPNLTVIKGDSSVSTYALMDAASKVIVFGSTAGIESVYWRKPVICLAAAYYKCMNITYDPKTLNDLWEYIDAPNLVCLYNKKVLMYGYYYMSSNHERTKYVKIDRIRTIFLGYSLQCYEYQKLFGSNFLYAFLIQGSYKWLCNKFPAKFKSLSLKEA